MLGIKAIWFLLVSSFIQEKCSVLVRTKLGMIKGTTMLSRNGNKFNAFLGIPYAKPPIGELRFRSPILVDELWNGTLNATTYGKKCIQPLQGKIEGSEDCLHLNVYTPRIEQNSELLPIWVFIFGGKKLFGEPTPYKYGPEYIMDKPVILITVSYRLGSFGFLSTEDEVIPGNFGLKDEVAALKWIQSHIISFGGDPTNVTISGGSSGAIDVSLHLLSSLSKGLFHKAISQSGQPLNSDAVHKSGSARELAWKLGKLVGCDGVNIKTSENLLKCLRKVPAKKLGEANSHLMHDYILPFMIYGPVIENKYSEDAFLVEDPCISMERSNSIPWLIGGIIDEGTQRTLTLFSDEKIVNHFEKNYAKLAPEFFRYSTFPNSRNVTEVIRKKYMGVKKLKDSFHEIAKIYAFGNFHLGTIESVKRYKSPVYLYLYDYVNRYAYFKTYLELLNTRTTFKIGAVHGEELTSLYNNPLLYPPVLDGEDRIVSNQVINLWYNFVSHGNPNGKNEKQLWKPVTPTNMEYLHINNLSLTMKTQYFINGEYKFWKEIGSPTLCSKLSN